MAGEWWKKLTWPKVRVDLKRVGEWIETGRSLAALLFIPFLCLYAAALVAIFVRVFAQMGSEAITLKVVDFLGVTLIGIVILIAFGVLWLQRREIPSLSITTPWGQASIGAGHGGDQGVVAAVVDAITPPGAPTVAAQREAAATGSEALKTPDAAKVLPGAEPPPLAEGEVTGEGDNRV